VATPVDPGPSRWVIPSALDADREGLVGVGADLAPATLLAAYRGGLFPMPVGRRRVLAWWSPDPRGILPLDGLHVSRSLAKSVRGCTTTVDAAFTEVLHSCADPRRPGGWITDEIRSAYLELHRLGWAHSVEAWTPDGELAGGLYGVCIGGLFAGESMFHRRRDGSKVALVGLVERLRAGGATLLDVQWTTPHLASLGAVDVPRADYLARLATAVAQPQTEPFGA
jgi:leucyl/phenylalanyl-tRNA--protein transferase